MNAKHGILAAWLVGEAIIVYRGAVKEKRPPWPSELFLSTAVFVVLGILADTKSLSTAAVVAGWGFDIAAWLRLFDKQPAASTNTPSAATSGGGPAGVASSQPFK